MGRRRREEEGIIKRNVGLTEIIVCTKEVEGGVKKKKEGGRGGILVFPSRQSFKINPGEKIIKKIREKFDFGLENTRDTDLSRYFVTEFF